MLGGQSEQGTTTGPQISANERENMEPSVELSSQLRVAVVHVTSRQNFNLLASRTISKTVGNWLSALLPESTISTSPVMSKHEAGWSRSHILSYY